MMVLLVLLCGMCQVPLRKSDQCWCVCWLCTSDGKRRSLVRSFDGWPQPVGSFLERYIDSSHPLIDFILINLSTCLVCHLIDFLISSTLSSHQLCHLIDSSTCLFRHLISLSTLSTRQLCHLINFVNSSTLSICRWDSVPYNYSISTCVQ